MRPNTVENTEPSWSAGAPAASSVASASDTARGPQRSQSRRCRSVAACDSKGRSTSANLRPTWRASRSSVSDTGSSSVPDVNAAPGTSPAPGSGAEPSELRVSGGGANGLSMRGANPPPAGASSKKASAAARSFTALWTDGSSKALVIVAWRAALVSIWILLLLEVPEARRSGLRGRRWLRRGDSRRNAADRSNYLGLRGGGCSP
mmetsp:Transcript_6161/g.18205  ORF Transcript_6161/g.18205 Transcript_6161/m.18205 type:complete len:205 (+) Transcript_6161:341-955(+)